MKEISSERLGSLIMSCFPEAMRWIFYALFSSSTLLNGRKRQKTFMFEAAAALGSIWFFLLLLYL